jgi:type I restriction-modification system DNA methylase subunit
MYSHDEIVNAVDNILLETLEETMENFNKLGNLTPLDKIRLDSIKTLLKNSEFELIRHINKPAIGTGRLRPDIWFYGGALIVEVKVNENEFKDGLKQLEDYIKEYFKDIAVKTIITNGLLWNFYNINKTNNNIRLELVKSLKANVISFNRSIIKSVKESKELWDEILRTHETTILRTQVYAYIPDPENVKKFFYPLLYYVDDLTNIINKHLASNKNAIYSSYEDIMTKLYTELKVERLLAIHTIIQIIVNAILSAVLKIEDEDIAICSGEAFGNFDITVPHLIWWKGISEAEAIMTNLCIEARNYTYLFDWCKEISIDVFSHLYEDFIEKTLRYKIGEYYTPWWLIELIIERLKVLGADIVNSTILDPSCGSGRFLVAFFHKKVEEGVNIDDAYYSIIGIDINPLAVSIARAELIIAYKNKTGKNPKGTPLIFWSDSLAPFIRAPLELVTELNKIQEALTLIFSSALANYPNFFENEDKNRNIILAISQIETLLTTVLKRLKDGEEVDTIINEFNELRKEDFNNIIYNIVSELLKCQGNILKQFLLKYGDGVWAIPITSSLIVNTLYCDYLKPDIVVTNPPWLEFNELPKSKWGNAVKEYIKNKYKSLPPQIYQKGDISIVFLDIALQMVKENGYVGFVLPASQSYEGGKSSHGVGKILTLRVLDRCSGEIIYVGDAFKHGQHASILCLRKVRK